MEEKIYCNKDKQYYDEESTFACEWDDMAYHVEYMTTASDGAEIMENNIDRYEEELNPDNFPEYDSKQPYDRF